MKHIELFYLFDFLGLLTCTAMVTGGLLRLPVSTKRGDADLNDNYSRVDRNDSDVALCFSVRCIRD